MKQGTNFTLPVKIDFDLSTVDGIEFMFEQGSKRLLFTYPSNKAVLSTVTDNTVNLIWSKDETYMFASGAKIKMDTRISVTGIDDNPETNIVEVIMRPTLFREEDDDE